MVVPQLLTDSISCRISLVDKSPKSSRFRFSLLSLLLLVTACFL